MIWEETVKTGPERWGRRADLPDLGGFVGLRNECPCTGFKTASALFVEHAGFNNTMCE